jgi:hypothetical protein
MREYPIRAVLEAAVRSQHDLAELLNDAPARQAKIPAAVAHAASGLACGEFPAIHEGNSALPLKADIALRTGHVRFVPRSDIG